MSHRMVAATATLVLFVAACGDSAPTGPVAFTDAAVGFAFDYPDAYRTSNMIDRHMEPMDRWLCSSRFFHGHLSSAERQVRAWALFHNFSPYCPRAKVSKKYHSPAHKLNGVLYHDNWLHNLLISASMAGADP